MDPGRIEPEAPEERGEARGGGDLAVGLVADALGFLPAPRQRAHEIPELDLGGKWPERVVQMLGGGAHRAPVHGQLGQPVALEEHERVEQVEKNGLEGHGRGFRSP